MKNFKTPEEYIDFVSLELEAANHHDYIKLPEKLFNKIWEMPCIVISPEARLNLARIIAEEFYKNI